MGRLGTDNQIDRGTLGHWLLYIQRELPTSRGSDGWAQRAQISRQAVGTHSGVRWGTENGTYREHRQLVRAGKYCKYRGQRHPDRQWAHTVGYAGALRMVHTEDIDNQSELVNTVNTEGTGNQPGGEEAGHRGHSQPDRQPPPLAKGETGGRRMNNDRMVNGSITDKTDKMDT